MAEQQAKKVAAITIRRNRPFPPKILIATGFKLRLEKSTGMVELLFETTSQKGERLILDPVLMQSNLDHIKKYVAAVPGNPDDSAMRDEVLVTEQAGYSNIIHMSRISNTAETIFGVFAISDWASETRPSTRSATGEIISNDSVVVMTTTLAQKKLLLELVLLIGNIPTTK